MEMLLISNGGLADALLDAMKGFFSAPELQACCFPEGQQEKQVEELRTYFTEKMAAPEKECLVLCDIFGSTAFNETAILVQKMHLADRVLFICGMNLPLVFKLYGLKDFATISLCRSLYNDPAEPEHGIRIFSLKDRQDAATEELLLEGKVLQAV